MLFSHSLTARHSNQPFLNFSILRNNEASLQINLYLYIWEGWIMKLKNIFGKFMIDIIKLTFIKFSEIKITVSKFW
jgi:hypothetical protein